MKKPIQMVRCLCVIAFLIFTFGCTVKEEAKLTAKGVELYTWQPQNGELHFWFLPGTNGAIAGVGLLKSNNAMVGMKNLKNKIDNLPEGECITWQHIGEIAIAENLKSKIIEYCREQSITLTEVYLEDIQIE